MFLSFLSHVLCAWFAFALPAYTTYKALSHPHSPDTLQALSTYWTVVGAFVAFEHTLGLFLSWLPFYWELRTIFLLYVALPQTSGYTYVYDTFLQPWLSRNEPDFDVAMDSAHTNAIAFCHARITALVDLVWGFVNKTPTNPDAQQPVDHLKGLWNAYAPSVLAAFAPKDPPDGHITHQPYSTN